MMPSQGASDVIDRLAQLQMIRSSHERVWRQIADIAAPDAGNFLSTGTNSSTTGNIIHVPHAAIRSKKIYDNTAVVAVDRLASGIEAMVVPQSEYWHGLGIQDFTHEDSTHEEKIWLERMRNLMFKIRYDADTGWHAAIQTCLRRLVAFGNAFMFVEEGDGVRSLTRYRAIPIEEAFVSDNHLGQIDCFYRPYTLTARQALQKFKENTPQKIITAAESVADKDRRFDFIHAIGPRADWGRVPGVRGAEFYSVHVSVCEKVIVGESGFYEFPIIDFRWLPDPGRVYGEGPVQKCLADIQSLNMMARNEMRASQQAVDPPLLVADAGVMNRPNTNPGAINFGGINAQGQKMVDTLFTGQRLDFATMVRAAKTNQVKEGLYLNLFQILTQNPQMSATEALIRANEKSDLLGPAGGRIQQSLSNLVERELGIMVRAGAFDRGSAFQPPQSVRNMRLGAQFTSPLDRLRRSSEATGAIRMLEILSPLMAIDESVADNFESDEMTRGLADVLGVPPKWVATPEKVQGRRQQRAEQAQQAQQAQIAKDFAAAGKQGSEALAGLQSAGF
jgi:hypothetical protein